MNWVPRFLRRKKAAEGCPMLGACCTSGGLLPPAPSADAVTKDYVDGQYQYGADATPWWAAGE